MIKTSGFAGVIRVRRQSSPVYFYNAAFISEVFLAKVFCTRGWRGEPAQACCAAGASDGGWKDGRGDAAGGEMSSQGVGLLSLKKKAQNLDNLVRWFLHQA